MSQTPISLLDRLRLRPDDAALWERLVKVYTPLLRGWLRRYDVTESDADDLIQEVMGVMVRELPRFEHNRQPGAFRSWLRSVLVNQLRAFWRARQHRPVATGQSDFLAKLDELADPGSGVSRLWDREHDLQVSRRLMELIQPEFQPTTWEAFRRTVIKSEKPSAVAAELGVSVNAVLIAKSRVLRRLRQEMQGLVE